MISEPRSDLLVWLDGELVPWHAAKVHVTAHHYGVGVFEGVRAYAVGNRTAIFRLADHTERLLRSSRILGMRLPSGLDSERLNAIQADVVARNTGAASRLRLVGAHAHGAPAGERLRPLRGRPRRDALVGRGADPGRAGARRGCFPFSCRSARGRGDLRAVGPALARRALGGGGRPACTRAAPRGRRGRHDHARSGFRAFPPWHRPGRAARRRRRNAPQTRPAGTPRGSPLRQPTSQQRTPRTRAR